MDIFKSMYYNQLNKNIPEEEKLSRNLNYFWEDWLNEKYKATNSS